MALYCRIETLTNTRGDSLVGYQVIARAPNGGAQLPIYSDVNGTPIVAVSGIPNVALTDETGVYQYYVAADSAYDEECSTPDGVFVRAIRGLTPSIVGPVGPAGPGGPPGDPGGAGNVALGRTQLKSLPVNYGDVWTLSEGLRSGNFLVMPAIFVPPADPQEGNYITANNGRVLQRIGNIKTANLWHFGAVGDGAHDGTNNPNGTPHWAGTDNTTAIQAAINYLQAVGGGTVYVPNGVYLVGGAFQADPLSPSQLLLPRFSSAVNAITIFFVGESMPDEQARDTGAIIQSTQTSQPSTQSWLLGGSSGGQHGATWLTVGMLNIGWRIPQNSYFGCVDHFYVQATVKDRVRFDVPDGISNVGGYATQTVLQPMSPLMVGYRGPLNDIPLWDIAGTVQSFGFYFGASPGELHNWRDYSASACWYPLLFEGQRHAGRVSRCIFTSCKNGVYIDGPLETNIDLLDIERTPAAASGLAWTAPYGDDIHDPNGWWRNGPSAVTTIHIHDLDSSGNQIQPAITGGINLRYQQVLLPNSANETYNSIFAGFGGTNGLVETNSLREIYSRTGRVPWYSNVIATTDPNAILVAFSAACANNGHRDYRNAQIAFVNDGAIDGGAILLQTQNAGGGMTTRVKVGKQGDVAHVGLDTHFTASMGGDIAGTVTVSGATTVSKSFTRSMSANAVVIVQPTAPLASGVTYGVATAVSNGAATGFTITLSASATATFNYFVVGG